jgi:hypothetical protein
MCRYQSRKVSFEVVLEDGLKKEGKREREKRTDRSVNRG